MKKIFNKILSSHVLHKDKDKDSNSYVYSKDINEKGVDVIVDLDIIFNNLNGSKYFISVINAMSVNKGILDLIGFFRKTNDCNTHIFSSGKNDNTFILDKVLSSGFSINSIYSHPSNKLSSKYIEGSKLLNLLYLLSSFSDGKKHKSIFILSSIEELYLINIIQNYIQGIINESEFHSSQVYKIYSSYIDFSKMKNVNLDVLAIFLLKQEDSSIVKAILNGFSKVCIFDNYLDISLGLFVSKIIDKNCFLSFLKYCHNHLGEDIDNILSKIGLLKDNNLVEGFDIDLFKIGGGNDNNKNKRDNDEKYYPISNYIVKEDRDFNELLSKNSFKFFSR